MRRALMVLVVATAAFAGQYDLLIGHCDPGSTSGVEDNIGGYPGYDSYTIEDWSTSTPTVAHLEEFGAVFTWSNYPYQDGAALGDNLATYMDGGGGVVSCCFAHYSSPGWGLGGTYVNDVDYCPITMGGVYYSYTSLRDTDDTNPVINGDAGLVSSIQNICYGEYCYKESPATFAADLQNGYILAAVNADENAVGINLYPGDGWTGDGWIMYNNAIMYMMEGDGAVVETTWGAIKAEF